MDIWDVIWRIDMILILIVGTFYALRELQDFWYNRVEHRIEKGKLKTQAMVETVMANLKGGAAATVDAAAGAVDGVVDGVRETVADGLEATADTVRPEE